MLKIKWMLCILALALTFPSHSQAKLELPRVFGSGMVVQRDKPVRIWGWGNKSETITIKFNGQEKSTTVDGNGRWQLSLDPMSVSAKPRELFVSAKSGSLTLENVVIGDVWLCSGQSNMEATAGGIFDSDLDMPRAKSPNSRAPSPRTFVV